MGLASGVTSAFAVMGGWEPARPFCSGACRPEGRSGEIGGEKRQGVLSAAPTSGSTPSRHGWLYPQCGRRHLSPGSGASISETPVFDPGGVVSRPVMAAGAEGAGRWSTPDVEPEEKAICVFSCRWLWGPGSPSSVLASEEWVQNARSD